MVGDGLGTDIKGANRMGWDALFAASGIHAVEIGELPHDEAERQLDTLFRENGVFARWSIPALSW
jgi:ribonucleotide monophosphatase NagD (HAD superfamily)